MSMTIHEFDGREGGRFRTSLTEGSPLETGKTSTHTDTYDGRFINLLPNEQVIEGVPFDTADQSLEGEMTITFTLSDKEDATEILTVHENLPAGLSAVDNETRWLLSLSKLAALVSKKP